MRNDRKMSKIDQKANYTIAEIARWPTDGNISLPTVQRGFVWKPAQIENLWDSLLRGYPVGAFVLSTYGKDNKLEMLDGQQRATAICLGLGQSTFRSSEEKFKIFIDLIPPTGDDSRKYRFRVITRSHPWGYQRGDNAKTLSADRIRKAMLEYGVDDYLAAGSLDDFYPADADLPIPFSFFIDANGSVQSSETIIAQVRMWKHWSKIEAKWNAQGKPKTAASILPDRIAAIRESCLLMLDKDHGQKIPALYLDFERIRTVAAADEDALETSALSDQEQEEQEESNDEIENLFVRLNAGGTPLQGEELNYSILKAHIPRPLQDAIEKSCVGLVSPARFVTIAYRLYQQANKATGRDAISLKIKPKQFQKAMLEDKYGKEKGEAGISKFELFLRTIVEEKAYEGKTFLQYVRHLLSYSRESLPFGFPHLVVTSFGESAPEVLFIFMYRLLIHKDTIKSGSDLHRRTLGLLTLLSWLGKGQKQRNHAKVLRNIWPCAATLPTEKFWSAITVARARLQNILMRFPSLNEKAAKEMLQILRNPPQARTSVWNRLQEADNDCHDFFYEILRNKMVLLYAQREFLANFFREAHFQLDDTSVPFDWDHISPLSYVHNKHNIAEPLRSFYATNGNFRAWPYSLNRMDQNVPPSYKLDPLSNNSIAKNDLAAASKPWEDFVLKHKHMISDIQELSPRLLEWSFCGKQWLSLDDWDLKTNWRPTYAAIIERNIGICREWYDQLKIEALIPKSEPFSVETVLDLKHWADGTAKNHPASNLYTPNDSAFFVSNLSVIPGYDVRFFVIWPHGNETFLEEDSIEFGFIEVNQKGFMKRIKIPDSSRSMYQTDLPTWIWSNFTLVSTERDSILGLISDISDWIAKCPNRELQVSLPMLQGLVAAPFRSKGRATASKV